MRSVNESPSEMALSSPLLTPSKSTTNRCMPFRPPNPLRALTKPHASFPCAPTVIFTSPNIADSGSFNLPRSNSIARAISGSTLTTGATTGSVELGTGDGAFGAIDGVCAASADDASSRPFNATFSRAASSRFVCKSRRLPASALCRTAAPTIAPKAKHAKYARKGILSAAKSALPCLPLDKRVAHCISRRYPPCPSARTTPSPACLADCADAHATPGGEGQCLPGSAAPGWPGCH